MQYKSIDQGCSMKKHLCQELFFNKVAGLLWTAAFNKIKRNSKCLIIMETNCDYV